MKVKFGAIIVAGSGKVGGHVVAKNRGGAYMRTKVTPLNPNTSAQAGARSLLSSLSTGWSGLTDAQRQSWNDAVGAFSKTDIFGDLRNPSGLNLYVKLNANLSNSGQSLLTSAPEKIEVPFFALQSATVDNVGDEIGFVFDVAPGVADIFKIRATPPMSQGVSFVKSQLRDIIYTPEITGEAGAIYSAYVAKFGVPPAGSNVVFSVTPIVATGQQGIAQSVKAVITG